MSEKTTDAMLPNATYEGAATIAGIELKYYVLDDGRRIIDMEGVNQLLTWLGAGNALSIDDGERLIELKEGRTVMERVHI